MSAPYRRPNLRIVHAINPLARRVTALGRLSGAESAAFEAELGQPKATRAHALLLGEGEGIATTRAIVSGWACQWRMLADGRRQIISLLLPGDFIGRRALQDALSPAAVTTLTPVEVVQLRRDGNNAAAPIERALRCDAILTEAFLFNQVMRLGRLSAYERVSHLLLELRDRLMLSGMASERSFALPLTQEHLADILGLTSVHVNRTLQLLRREGMIELSRGQVELFEPDTLARLSEYTPPNVLAEPLPASKPLPEGTSQRK